MHSGDWADLCAGELLDRLVVFGGEPQDTAVMVYRISNVRVGTGALARPLERQE